MTLLWIALAWVLIGAGIGRLIFWISDLDKNDTAGRRETWIRALIVAVLWPLLLVIVGIA